MSGPRLALFFATSGHSGVDRLAHNLMRAFVARGAAVDLLHVAGHGPDPETAPAGVRVVPLGTRHAYTSVASLARYLRRERPRALLADKHKVNLTALAARALARVPTRVVIRTGTTVSANLAARPAHARALHRAAVGALYPRADAFVMPSQGAADDMAAFAGLARGRISVIANPVVDAALAAAAATPVDHPWLADDARLPLVLGVGELSARKDFATLVRAFAILRRARACRLLILGEGRQRPRLQQLAEALDVAADLDMPGFVVNPQAYMARADVFAASARWEGLSNVLVEALAAGVPAVATDCPSGPREILAHGEFGALVPVGDAAALAAALARTLAAPTDAKALQTAAARYDVAARADDYLALLLADADNASPTHA